MDPVEADDEAFSPADVSRWFGVPRTTLFRWESEGVISKAEREGPKSERVYRRRHLAEIQQAVRKRIKTDLALSVRHGSRQGLPTLDDLERLYLSKFIGNPSPQHGLRELKALAQKPRGLSQDTVELLADYALRRPRGDAVRLGIWELMIAHDRVDR